MSDPTISVQDTSNLVLQIRELLKGIDECETDTDDGWWETSVGAEFGRKKLEELIDLVETKMQWVGFIDESHEWVEEVVKEVPCKPHPDAPHGFLRNASHNADRYVCECEHWEEPKMSNPIAWLNPDPDYEQICPEIGYEATYCEQHPKDLGWIPLYAQREWVGMTDEQMLGNLLARIHRDGGHYQGTHGVKKACEDAEAKVVGWLSMEHEIESTKEKNT